MKSISGPMPSTTILKYGPKISLSHVTMKGGGGPDPFIVKDYEKGPFIFLQPSLSRFRSCVCLISSTSSESGQVDEVAKLAKSGLFGAPVYTKSLSWHNFGQNISDISKLLSSWLSHLCLCFCEGRECCFVFVAEFQNFMDRLANAHISSVCFTSTLRYGTLHWSVRGVRFQCD